MNDVLKEAPLNKVPEFYDSISNNPINDILDNRPVYSSMYIFRGFSDFQITIDALSSNTYILQHNIQAIPIIKVVDRNQNFKFIPFYDPVSYSVDDLTIYPTYYTLRVTNFFSTQKTINLRSYLFEIKLPS